MRRLTMSDEPMTSRDVDDRIQEFYEDEIKGLQGGDQMRDMVDAHQSDIGEMIDQITKLQDNLGDALRRIEQLEEVEVAI